jgi:hypothetical protein
MRRDITVRGIDDMIRQLNRHMGEAAVADIDRITESYARKMAEESAALAPIDSGALKGSIASSPEVSEDSDHVWQYGSDLPYALRQEYENPTHKGFIRKAVWNNRNKYRDAVKNRITEG